MGSGLEWKVLGCRVLTSGYPGGFNSPKKKKECFNSCYIVGLIFMFLSLWAEAVHVGVTGRSVLGIKNTLSKPQF